MKVLKTENEWKDLLQKEYVTNKKSARTIAAEYDCTGITVLRWLHRLKFNVRTVAEALKGKKLSLGHRQNISKGLMGRKPTKETKLKLSNSRKGMKFTKEHRLNLSKNCYRAYGEKHWNWRGGKAPESIKRRKSVEYKDWRLKVFLRDGFTCVGCGDNRGRNLQAHHKLSVAKYPELIFDVLNGATLCKNCHRKVHPDLGFVGMGRA